VRTGLDRTIGPVRRVLLRDDLCEAATPVRPHPDEARPRPDIPGRYQLFGELDRGAWESC
jgi:hypothetical protein